MGMKVAAVSVMCQDQRVFEAMLNAGTPCPKDGLIGDAARTAWEVAENPEPKAEEKEKKDFTNDEKTLLGAGSIGILFLILLL